MPVDMPPQPASYHVERAAPVSRTPDFLAIARASRAVSDRLRIADAPSRAQAMLPALDPASASMTDADRAALVGAMRADWGTGMAEGRLARPDSYVGERIGVSYAYANARLALQTGSLDSSDAQSIQCRAVAVALDARAGRYLEGGEAAAQRARSLVTPEMRRDCAASIDAARLRTSVPAPRAASVAAGRVDASRTATVRVDQPVRPAFVPTRPQQAQTRISVSYGAAQAAARGIGG